MKYMEKGERQLYLNYLTESQKEVLERYHKEEKNSVLQNQIFGQSDEWEFIDIEVSANYRDKSKSIEERLWCECGVELKYQYILLDRIENQTRKLGVKHFEEHAGIPDNIARQILKKKYQLDEWLDDILLTFKEHKQDIELKAQYQQTIDTFMTKTNNAPIEQRIPLKQGVITEKDLKLFHDFKDVGLPLPTKLYKKIEQALQNYKEKEIAEAREKILWEKIKSSKHLYKAQTSKKKEYQEAIGECRIAMDKLLNKGEEIPFNTLYLRARQPMEKLFKEFEKEKVIQLVANSVNQYSNNKMSIDWEAKAFIKTGEKT